MKTAGAFFFLDDALKSALEWSFSEGWTTPLANTDVPLEMVASPGAFIALRNAKSVPWRLEMTLCVSQKGLHGSFLALIDDRPIERFYLENCPEKRECKTTHFLVSSGGHQIRFLLEDGLELLSIESIHLTGYAVSHEELTESFPFDLFQRYAAVREILPLLYPPSLDRSQIRLLDYGGLMGGTVGHLGSIADFLPSFSTTLADTRFCDLPHFVSIQAGDFPFRAGEFSSVICLDVLEHIPKTDRETFLLKLLETASDWLIIGCPFADPAIEDAEFALDAFIQNQLGYKHSFLAEHTSYGLPTLAEIQKIFTERGKQFVTLPNGYLPRWFFMQCVNFFISGLQCDHLAERINRFYNRYFFPVDKQLPAYRHLIVVDVRNHGGLDNKDLMSLWSEKDRQPPPHWTDLGHLLLELLNLSRLDTLQKEARRLSFLLSSREQLILQQQLYQKTLEEQLGHYQNRTGHLEKERLDLQQHTSNLEAHSHGLEAHVRGLESHCRELSAGIHRLELDAAQAVATQQKIQQDAAELRDQVHHWRQQVESPTIKDLLRVMQKMIGKRFGTRK